MCKFPGNNLIRYSQCSVVWSPKADVKASSRSRLCRLSRKIKMYSSSNNFFLETLHLNLCSVSVFGNFWFFQFAQMCRQHLRTAALK